MTTRLALLLTLAALPAHAQVIEIGEGVIRTYAGPTRFTDSAAQPLLPARPAPPAKHAASAADLAPAITASAAAHGLDPRLVEAVAWRESRLHPEALSPRGARGIMQLMPATARDLDIDPRDTVANIEGGTRYLRQMADRFGAWPLALAAYNAGPGAVARFGGIPPFAETRAYVAAVLTRWQRTAPVAPPALPANPLLIEVPAP